MNVTLLPWALAALLASHAGAVWYGWNLRGDVERDRVSAAQAQVRVAQARVVGLAEAQALAEAERDRLREDLNNAANSDPDAGRVCLSAGSVRRLDTP